MSEVKRSKSDAREFAQKLKEMVTLMEQRTRTANKIQEYLYRHVASSSRLKQLHCLALKLANEHSINAAARLQLPEDELVPTLVDNNYFHFVLASDNILAASVVAKEGSGAGSYGEESESEVSVQRWIIMAAKLQALSPKYNSLMNHIRIHLPELFPSLNKVVFLDDDIVIQTDLLPLWDIDMDGKVNGAVETCRGEESCQRTAWRKTNISSTYYHWLDENLKSDLSLWQLGTLPPGLIAFHGHVQTIDPFWNMLGLGYQETTSFSDAESPAFVHFNGRAKPWLDIAFPHLRPLWAKHLDSSDRFIKSCHIRASY
ncbi:hypothetical protein Bca4012_001454 [Brassica carinata]